MSTIISNAENITYGLTVEMVSVICCSCAVPFCMPQRLKEHYLQTQEYFFCPNGHRQHYSKSTETILKEKIERIQQEKEREINSLRQTIYRKEELIVTKTKETIALKGKHTKLKNRIANGICPCCNRSFSNLHNHIKNQHPDYVTPIFQTK